MLNPEGVQLIYQAFVDPAVEEEYQIGILTATNSYVMARLIPQSPTANTWMTESTRCSSIKSQAIMSSYGYLQTPENSLLLLMEPAEYNLAFDIEARNQQGRKYELVEVVEILESCLEGLGAIYRLPEATKGHGNLTPSSIFKSTDGSYKLGNFCSVLASTRDQKGPYKAYIYPQYPLRRQYYQNPQQPWQVDFFDLGVLLLHLCELQEPLGLNDVNQFPTVNQYKERFGKAPKEYKTEKLVELFCYLMQENQTQVEQAFDKAAEMLLQVKLRLPGKKLIKSSIQLFRPQNQQAVYPASYSQLLNAADPPKEGRKEWQCTSCTTAIASCFCTCGGKETFLCDSCYPAHFTKYLRAVHFVIPMTAYGNHKTPGYFERLQARSIYFPDAVTEIRKNIEEIDKSIEKVSSEIQSVLNTIYEYGTKVVSELQQLKSELENEINDSIAEVERTIHDNSPVLQNPLAKVMREFKGDSNSLQIFNFSVNIDKITEDIETMCSYAAIRPSGYEYILPGIQGKQLVTYNIENAKYSSIELPSTFTQGSVLCNIGFDNVLIVGAEPATSDAFLANVSSGEMSITPQMNKPRRCPGLISVNQFAFVFGGSCVECEKFDIPNNAWINLPKMSKEKSSFNPCLYQCEIYLICAPSSIEVFHLNSERFRELQVNLSGMSGHSTCVCRDGEFIITTDSSHLAMWKPTSASAQIKGRNGNSIASQCPPVLFKDEIYFVAKAGGVLNSFNISTLTVARKSRENEQNRRYAVPAHAVMNIGDQEWLSPAELLN